MTATATPSIACTASPAINPAAAAAQEPIRFARTPDISPDGTLIAYANEYQGSVSVIVEAFVVVVVGGLGSVGGCFLGALLVGLVGNYTGYLAPKLALGSNILLMVLVLLWRPQGIFGRS